MEYTEEQLDIFRYYEKKMKLRDELSQSIIAMTAPHIIINLNNEAEEAKVDYMKKYRVDTFPSREQIQGLI